LQLTIGSFKTSASYQYYLGLGLVSANREFLTHRKQRLVTTFMVVFLAQRDSACC